MYALYITHPQVRIDPDVPVPEWDLSDIGAERARRAFAQPWARQIRQIVSSTEKKALETARILAASGGLEIESFANMHENDRSATGFLPPEKFEQAADWFFSHPQESFHGWETAADAQRRIVEAVTAVLAKHDPTKPIAFVGHGAVGTLLKSHLQGTAISRYGDQPSGGGNLFRFNLADMRVTCDWTPIETWQG